MSASSLHVAGDDEVRQIWPAVEAAGLFETWEAFDRFRREAPWRVQVTERGEAVVLERWRSHLDVLSIRGLWGSVSRIPQLAAGVGAVALRQGYGKLLSPLVPEDAAPDWEQAGMTRHSSVVVIAKRRGEVPPARRDVPEGVSLRPARPRDLTPLLALDGSCFDEFWRYDAERMGRYLCEERVTVAEESGLIIGYTLCTLLRDGGSVGRLAVARDARRRGLGSALLTDALGYFARTGAGSVSLCTQEENHASRALYRRMGLAELEGTLVFLVAPAARVSAGDPDR